MPSLFVTDAFHSTKQIEFEPGLTLMEVLTDEGYDAVQALCGGCCSCGTCHVHVEPSGPINMDEIEEDEAGLLEYQENYNPERSRLSCQIELDKSLDGLRVQIVSN